MWLTGEMSDSIKFQFDFKTFIYRDYPLASYYLKKSEIKRGIHCIKFRSLFLNSLLKDLPL